MPLKKQYNQLILCSFLFKLSIAANNYSWVKSNEKNDWYIFLIDFSRLFFAKHNYDMPFSLIKNDNLVTGYEHTPLQLLPRVYQLTAL